MKMRRNVMKCHVMLPFSDERPTRLVYTPPMREKRLWVSVSTILFLSSCENAVETLHKIDTDSYTPTALWDAMLGNQKQDGHVFSQSGPSPLSYVHIKGVVSRVELAPDNAADSPALPVLLFDVDRSSVWNGIPLHGSVRAPFEPPSRQPNRLFGAGEEVELTCQIGAAVMPFVYLMKCQLDR